MEQFDRITHNHAIMGGKACIRGMRVTVGNILEDFPYLEKEDVFDAMKYAAWN